MGGIEGEMPLMKEERECCGLDVGRGERVSDDWHFCGVFFVFWD